MGKSGTTSCFKFAGCGDPDSVDRDDLPAAEIKDSNDKRKWSFRKRSPAHRVLSNSVISETSLGNKSSLDTATVGFQKQATCTDTDSKLAEKISPAVEKSAADVILDEFSAVEKNAADVTPDEKNAADGPPDEFSAVEKNAQDITPDEKNAADVPLDELSAVKKNAAEVNPVEKNAADVPLDEFSAVEKSAAEVNPDESSAVEKGAAAVTPDESSVIIIQTAVRGFLAQKDLTKNNAMIMLQAAIRGYIVRKAAVGSLRCVHVIVKMQDLIRKRRACSLQEGSKFDEKDGKLDKQDSKGMEKMGSKLVTYTPIEELLRNSFARQLLESDLRSKAINIKCEPLKSDSAWKWMERWMSLYSNGSRNNSPGLEYATENPDEKSLDKSDYVLNSVISQKDNCQSKEPKSSEEESVVPSEGDENAIRYGMPSFEPNNDMGRPCPVTTCSENRYDDVSDSFPDQATESGFTSSHREPDSFANESEMECKQQIESKFSSITKPDSLTNQSDMGSPHPLTTCLENHYDDVSDSLPDQATESSFASNKEPFSFTNPSEREYKEHIESSCGASIMEPVSLTNQSNSSETTGKKVVLSRRSSNSAFIAAQSKFEELSLAANSAKPVGLSKQDASLQLPSNGVSLVTDIRKKNTIPAKASLTPASEVDVAIGSESVTELSFSSTLDSPHGDVIDGASDAVKNTSVLEDKDDDYQKNHMNSTVDTEVDSPIMKGISVQEDKYENIASDGSNNDGSATVHVETETSHPPSTFSPEASPRRSHITGPDTHETPSSQVSMKPKKGSRENVQTESSHPLSPLSPQASPGSHVTGPDSQETPSSHVSVKSKKSGRRSVPDRKQKSGSSGNGYKSDSNHVSSTRNALEQLSVDKKTGKRRNSFGSASTDHGNQEQRESSSNSIPSYMQATESARAKAIANNSPRSIPDTLGKDFHIKKRHSLPGVNTKHVPPQAQAQQSTSQTLQDAKANGVHSPQERKWRR